MRTSTNRTRRDRVWRGAWCAALVTPALIALTASGAAAVRYNPPAPLCGDFTALATGAPDLPGGSVWEVTWVSHSDTKYAPGTDEATEVVVLTDPHPGWHSPSSGAYWVGHPAFGTTGGHSDADGDGNLNEGSVWGVPITGDTGDWIMMAYTASFSLTPGYEDTTVLSFDYFVDDAVVDIVVNGVSRPLPPATTAKLKEVDLDGWLAGTNTVTFVADSGPDFGAFLVEGVSVSQTGDIDDDAQLDCDDADFDRTPYDEKVGHEGDLVRLYRAALGRHPEGAGYEYWLEVLRAGVGLEQVAELFAESSEFDRRFGNTTDDEFIELLYQNLLFRQSDPGGAAHWRGVLDGGASRGDLVRYFAETAEFGRIHQLG